MKRTNNRNKKIVIIGAGLAGLATGCYGRMNGFDVEIFEQHNISGGLITSWKRKGYLCDGCLDWLIGINSQSNEKALFNVWRELGILKGKKIAYMDNLLTIKDEENHSHVIHVDPAKLQDELLKLTGYKEDRKRIISLCRTIKRFSKSPAFYFYKPVNFYNFFDKLRTAVKSFFYLGDLIKFNDISIREYTSGFKSEKLRHIISYIFFTPDISYSMFAPVFSLAHMYKRTAGFPEGGSSGIAGSVESRFLDLGGKIQYNRKVKRILVKQGRAFGIELSNGGTVHGDYIVSACDGHSTIYKMLNKQFLSEDISALYSDAEIYPSMVRTFIGVRQDFSGEPHTTVFLADKDFDFPGSMHTAKNEILIRHFCEKDPAFAPEENSILVSFYFSDYEYWKNLYKNRSEYKLKKDKIAKQVIEHLEKHHPGISEKIDFVDVSTPATIERYTKNYRGSIMGWSTVNEMDILEKGIKMTLPGLDRFFMVGQWVVSGGLPPVALSGRYLVEQICKREKLKFATSKI